MTKKQIIILVTCVVLAVITALFFILRGRTPSKAVVQDAGNAGEREQNMLIDFCKKKVATVGGNGYSETVLYQNADGSCEVHYYSRYDGDTEETHSAYPVDRSVIEEAYGIINKNGIAGWNDKRYGPGPDGTVYILKFRADNGEYIRVTSDNMPENGIEIVCSVNECLSSHVKEGSGLDLPDDKNGNNSLFVADMLDTTEWVGKTAEELGISGHVDTGMVRITGAFLGLPASGLVSFSGSSQKADSIRITVQDGSVTDFYEKLKDLYGGCLDAGMEPYVASNGGAVRWYSFTTGATVLMIQQGSNNSFVSVHIVENPDPESSVELALRKMEEPDPEKMQGRVSMRVLDYANGILTVSIVNKLGKDFICPGKLELAKSNDNGQTYDFLIPVETMKVSDGDTEMICILDNDAKELTLDLREYGKVERGKYMIRNGDMRARFELLPVDEALASVPEIRWFCPECGRQNIDTDVCAVCGKARDQS